MKNYLLFALLASQFLYSSGNKIEWDTIKKILSGVVLFSVCVYLVYKGIEYIRYLKDEEKNLKRKN